MPDDRPSPRPNWWTTLPGLLTAAAAFLTAVTGLLATARQLGWLDTSRSQAVSTKAAPKAGSPSPAAISGPSSTETRGFREFRSASPSSAERQNLLAEANGGKILLAPSDEWKAAIDGDETGSQLSFGTGKEAVFAFRDGRRATFDTFTMLIENAAMANVKEFELFVGDESPTGKFRSIGKFRPQNVKRFDTPYQEFRFEPVTARYLKVKIHSCHGAHPWIHEWQLLGRLEGV